MAANPALVALLRAQLDGMDKQAFTPAPALAGDPATGAAPPVDPAMAAAAPQGAPPGAPPGGDPAAAGAPPADPAAAGGMPPPGLDPMLQQAITMAVQQAMQGAGGAPGAGGKRTGGKGGDETASQLYKMNTMLTAMIEGLNRAGMDIQVPVQMMLGPPPGSDPAAAVAMAPQPGAQPGPPGAPPGAPAGAPPGGDPTAAMQAQQSMPAAGKLAALLEREPAIAEPIGHAVYAPRAAAPAPRAPAAAPTVAGFWNALHAG